MASLTEISYYARKGILWGGIGLVVIMFIPITVKTIKEIYLKLNPPPPAPPTIRYGKLPQLKFPGSNNVTKTTYKLETISGGLPSIAKIGRVYLVGINKSRLLELDRAKTRALTLGFTNDPITIDDQTYKFVHPTLPATLTVNLLSGGFAYQYDYKKEKQLFIPTQLPTADQASEIAKNFLAGLAQLPQDLAEGTTKSVYLIASPSGQVAIAPSYSDANMVKVDLYRADKDGMKVVTAAGDSTPVNALITGSQETPKKVVGANFQYSMIVGEDFATYPLKTVDQAWGELSSGKGYVNQNRSNETIRTVTLAYYESNSPQEFLQPVFVFTGDNNFQGLIPAIDPTFVQ